MGKLDGVLGKDGNLTQSVQPAKTSVLVKKTEIQKFLSSPTITDQLTMALPKVGITPDRMVRLMLSAFGSKPKLLECSKVSILNSMIQSASLGLEPESPLGHAYLIKYGTECKFQIGYKGLRVLAKRSGEISVWNARVVFEGDEFDYLLGTTEYIKHKPSLDRKDDTGMKFAYSVVTLKDGSTDIEVMTKNQVDAIRARSKSPNNGPWVTDYIAMARKTVMKRHANYLPLTIELSDLINKDNETEFKSNTIVSPDQNLTPEESVNLSDLYLDPKTEHQGHDSPKTFKPDEYY